MFPRRRAIAALALATILALGASLRVRGLERAEPFLWDDAVHHLEGVFLRDLAGFVRGSVERKLGEARGEGDLWTWPGERARFAAEVGGLPLRHARPGHALLTAAVLDASGDAPWSGAALAAAAGSATLVLLFFWIARAPPPIGGVLPALFATAWLAVDPLHVQLSREGLADADGLLFALVALMAYARARHATRHPLGWMALVGLLTGIAFTVQTRNFLVVGAVLAWEALPGPWRVPRPHGERWARVASFGGAAALPLAAVESVYYLAFLIGRSHGVVPPFRPYSLQVLTVFARHSVALEEYVEASKVANLASYPLLGQVLHGSWLPVVLGVVATVALIRLARRERSRDAWILVSWLVGTVAFLSWTVPLARYAAFFLPAAAWTFGIVTARAVACLRVGTGDGQPGARRLSSAAPAVAWLLGMAVAAGLACAASLREVDEVRPGYHAAIEWMEAHEGARHLSTQPFVSQVWVGSRNVEFLPANESEVAERVEDGYRYLLVDLIRNFFLGAFEPQAERVREIAERCERVAVIDNAWAARPEFLFEFNYDVKATMERVRRARAGRDDYGVIEIYDLRRCDAGGAP